jgi:hypothetical protein
MKEYELHCGELESAREQLRVLDAEEERQAKAQKVLGKRRRPEDEDETAYTKVALPRIKPRMPRDHPISSSHHRYRQAQATSRPRQRRTLVWTSLQQQQHWAIKHWICAQINQNLFVLSLLSCIACHEVFSLLTMQTSRRTSGLRNGFQQGDLAALASPNLDDNSLLVAQIEPRQLKQLRGRNAIEEANSRATGNLCLKTHVPEVGIGMECELDQHSMLHPCREMSATRLHLHSSLMSHDYVTELRHQRVST